MGGALVRGICCPYKRDTRELLCPVSHVKTQKKDSLPSTRKQILTGHQICQGLGLGLPSLQNCKKYIYVVVFKQTTQSVVFCYSSLNRLKSVSTLTLRLYSEDDTMSLRKPPVLLPESPKASGNPQRAGATHRPKH